MLRSSSVRLNHTYNAATYNVPVQQAFSRVFSGRYNSGEIIPFVDVGGATTTDVTLDIAGTSAADLQAGKVAGVNLDINNLASVSFTSGAIAGVVLNSDGTCIVTLTSGAIFGVVFNSTGISIVSLSGIDGNAPPPSTFSPYIPPFRRRRR